MFSMYSVWVSAYVCVDKGDKGDVGDRELKTSMYCVWLCADGGGPWDMRDPTYVPCSVCGYGWEGDQGDKGIWGN